MLWLGDPCASQPCMNQGNCISENGGFRCVCPAGYSGNRCEDRDACQSNPCMNGGTCQPTNGNAGYQCLCPSGFSGLLCETSTLTSCFYSLLNECIIDMYASFAFLIGDVCAQNPCLNGGQCMLNDVGGFTCVCIAPYTGQRCEDCKFERML